MCCLFSSRPRTSTGHMSMRVLAGISLVANTPRPADAQLGRLIEIRMVTNVQPFGVSLLISKSGQRCSEMLGSSTNSPMFACSRELWPEQFLSFDRDKSPNEIQRRTDQRESVGRNPAPSSLASSPLPRPWPISAINHPWATRSRRHIR
jgi:hypothetical protein